MGYESNLEHAAEYLQEELKERYDIEMPYEEAEEICDTIAGILE